MIKNENLFGSQKHICRIEYRSCRGYFTRYVTKTIIKHPEVAHTTIWTEINIIVAFMKELL